MSIEGHGLKGDLAPKKAEESKLKGTLLRQLKAKTEAGKTVDAEKFSRAWVEGRVFVFNGKPWIAKVEDHEKRGAIVILKEQKDMGATTNFDFPVFIQRLKDGDKWTVKE